METISKFKACGVALITPFNADKSIDFPALKTIIENNIAQGTDYFVALGTTAETPCLSQDEKNELVRFSVNQIDGRKPLVVGFSGNSTAQLVEEINQFDFTGVDAILCASPYYNKPSQDGIYEHYSHVAKASPVPLILYNIPGRTSSNIEVDTVIKLAKDFENIIGIKEASGNFHQIMETINRKPQDFLVISGDDALTVPMISVGAEGVISVLANALPHKMSNMVHAALSADAKRATALHQELLELFFAMSEEGNPTGIKSLLNILGLTKNNLRLPLMRASSELSSRLNILQSKLSK